MGEKNYSKVPVFENGLAQPVFKFTERQEKTMILPHQVS